LFSVNNLSLAAELEIFESSVNEIEETCKAVHDGGKIVLNKDAI
jgi:hypothetical protein